MLAAVTQRPTQRLPSGYPAATHWVLSGHPAVTQRLRTGRPVMLVALNANPRPVEFAEAIAPSQTVLRYSSPSCRAVKWRLQAEARRKRWALPRSTSYGINDVAGA